MKLCKVAATQRVCQESERYRSIHGDRTMALGEAMWREVSNEIYEALVAEKHRIESLGGFCKAKISRNIPAAYKVGDFVRRKRDRMAGIVIPKEHATEHTHSCLWLDGTSSLVHHSDIEKG